MFVGVAVVYLFQLGVTWVVVAVVMAVLLTWGAYWSSDKIALRVSRAREASEEEFPRLHNLIDGLCIAAGLPKPRLYVVDDPAPNAFATGRNPQHSAVAVTTGLLDRMNRMELEGVLAHELSHIKNYDILVNTIAVTMVGFLTLLADVMMRTLWFSGHRRRDSSNGPQALLGILGLVLVLVAPLIGKLMQLAIGRRRETLADLSAIEITRYPPGLIAALEKLREDRTVVGSASRATAHLWIEEPMARSHEEGNAPGLNRLFATHPPLDERIALLREL